MTINFLFQLLLKGLFLGTLCYLLICTGLRLWQNRLIFVPSSIIEYTPKYLGLAYEDVWVPVLTLDGKLERIHGWWIPSQFSSGDVLLYFHGNGGNISSNLGPVQRFHQMGFDVFIIDYRGYGQSEGGFPSESEVYRDAQTAWDYLIQKRSVKPENIFIYGHSLGGAIALDLAVRKPNAGGVIVENTFTSMREMVDHLRIYRFLPINWILRQNFDSKSKLRLLRVPLLLIHGKEDRTVPFYMSQVLYEQAPVPKKIFLVPDAGHNNVGYLAEKEYFHKIQEFCQMAKSTQRSFVGL